MTMSVLNPDAMAIAGALTRFIENPRGTITVKADAEGEGTGDAAPRSAEDEPARGAGKISGRREHGR